METSDLVCDYGLEHVGLEGLGTIYWNLSTPALYEHAIHRYEGHVSHLGPLIVNMGQHTGRAAKDKYVVDQPDIHKDVWWGKINVPYAEDRLNRSGPLTPSHFSLKETNDRLVLWAQGRRGWR